MFFYIVFVFPVYIAHVSITEAHIYIQLYMSVPTTTIPTTIPTTIALTLTPTIPMQVRDAGNLLTACGFGIPTVDVDDVIMQYDSALDLVTHVRSMGEGNAVKRRRPVLRCVVRMCVEDVCVRKCVWRCVQVMLVEDMCEG